MADDYKPPARIPEDPDKLAAAMTESGYVRPPESLIDAIGTQKLGSPPWYAIEQHFRDTAGNWHNAMLCFISERYKENLADVYWKTDSYMKDRLGLRGYN